MDVTRGAAITAVAIGGVTAATKAIARYRRTRTRTRETMSTPAVTVDAGASVSEAAELFAATGVGVLPVCEGNGRPVGVVTDRDLVVRVLGQDSNGSEPSVGEVAEPQPVVAQADAPVAATAEVMRRHAVRRLPVVEDGRLVGVVSRADLAQHLPARAADGLHEIGGEQRSSDRRSGRWLFERPYV